MVRASFIQQEYTVNEDEGPMIVGVQLDRKVQRRIVIQVLLRHNSAKGTVH